MRPFARIAARTAALKESKTHKHTRLDYCERWRDDDVNDNLRIPGSTAVNQYRSPAQT
jgi:hypothetical protein